ncbi:MAG: hypothetical protein HC936_19015 [Leptolyngbyaceae cyanobacterium SU_3_3]|nr:hypothetical protein [Leptolyngbyaceae cyanobacterium SU_3_3]
MTGMILGIKTVDSHPQEVIDILAAATGDLFQGANVVTIEKLFKRARGVPEYENVTEKVRAVQRSVRKALAKQPFRR